MVLIFLFTLIGCCLFIVYGALIDYYRRSWIAIPTFGADAQNGETASRPGRTLLDPEIAAGLRLPQRRTRISVLVPARNEEANIARCIESLWQQSYPKDLYEVIIIDDHSTDLTGEIVSHLHFAGLSLLYLPLGDGASRGDDASPRDGASRGAARSSGPPAYKKLAIEAGVRAASGELIVTTDADCIFHPEWLATLAAFYEERGAKFIAAPVRIGGAEPIRRTTRVSAIQNRGQARPTKPAPRVAHSFLSIFQTLDFITLQGITGAAVSKRFHSMCNGANLAYEKSAFYEVDGFQGIASVPSGDDMLLMHKIFLRYPDKVLFLKSPQAIVSTNPATTWSDFVHQRIRWASKADRYDDKRIFWVLLLVYIVNVMFALLPIAACWNTWWLLLLVIGLLTKTMLEFPFVYTVAGFFDQQLLMRWFPLMQPLHIIYTVVIGWMGKFGSYRWKDRKVSR